MRRRTSRGFEYQITIKGQDRLFYLWKKFGETNPDRKLTGKEAN